MFPDLILDTLKTHLATLDGVEADCVVLRPLRPTDENKAVGIYELDWTPEEYEMRGRMAGPSLVSYRFAIQHLVKHESEEEGRRVHRAVAKSLIALLYDNDAFQLAFRSLVDATGAHTERIQRWHVSTQRYASNEISGQYVAMSGTELTVEVQTV